MESRAALFMFYVSGSVITELLAAKISDPCLLASET